MARLVVAPARPPGKDPRITALRRFASSITAFTVLGHLWLGFEQAYVTPVVAVLTGYLLELVLETLDAWGQQRQPRYRGSLAGLVNFLLPAHIAGLACAMLLYGNESVWPTVFAVSIAVASKYVVRVTVGHGRRHVLNPSNFGISVTLVCFSWVSIAPPYHFTENVDGVIDWVIPAAILVAGTMLNGTLTRRLPLILGWVGGFALQAVLRAVLFDHALAAALLPMTGVAFILFTNYMITDPGTTPSAPRRQVVFGLATAFTYGALVLLHVTFGLFFALVLVCIGRLIVVVVGARSSAAAPPSGSGLPAAPVSPAPVAARDHVTARR